MVQLQVPAGNELTRTTHTDALEGVSLKWSIFIGIFENLEKMSPKSMKLQGNKLKIVYKSAKNAQNPQKWTISVIHLLAREGQLTTLIWSCHTFCIFCQIVEKIVDTFELSGAFRELSPPLARFSASTL